MKTGVVCRYSCPYFKLTEGQLLCQLYNSLSLFGSGSGMNSGPSSSASTNLNLYNGTFSEPACPYLNLTDGTLICSLWCQLLSAMTGYTCVQPTLAIQVSSNINHSYFGTVKTEK
jgi:hypothetical protein